MSNVKNRKQITEKNQLIESKQQKIDTRQIKKIKSAEAIKKRGERRNALRLIRDNARKMIKEGETDKAKKLMQGAKKILEKKGLMSAAKKGFKALPGVGAVVGFAQALKSGDAMAAVGPENVGQGSELKESERDKAIERARKMWKKRQQK